MQASDRETSVPKKTSKNFRKASDLTKLPETLKSNRRTFLEKKSKSELIDALLEFENSPVSQPDSSLEELERVYEALDTLPGTFALFDSNDRFVFVNQAYRGINSKVANSTVKGTKFETYLRSLLDDGLIPAAIGREKQWIESRLELHRNPSNSFEQVRNDGTELKITETKLRDGSILLKSENVSAQKQADKALAESEIARSLLSSAIDEISEGIALFDENDRLVLANKSWLAMNAAIADKTKPGVSFKEHVWHCIEAGLIPQAIGQEKEWAASRFSQHENPGKPFEVVRGDGRVNLVHEQVLTNGGRILVILDVTEQKRLQTRLEEGVESINDAFILVDAEGNLVLSNSKFKEFFPPLADLLIPGTPFETLFRASVGHGLHTDKSSADEAFIQDRLNDFFTGEGIKERRLSDGRWIMVHDRKTPSGEIVGIRTDITELKRREEEASHAGQTLLDAIESISDGFILFDADLRMVMCNSKYKEYYAIIEDILQPGVSYKKVIEVIMERKGIVIEDDGLKKWKKQRMLQFESAQGFHHQQMADGRWILATERRTKTGGVVGIRTEITDIVKAEYESRKALAAAENANRAKSDFLANMSHELRTPLNAIIGFSSVISDEMYGPLNNPSYLEYAGDIQRSGVHLLNLISDLLDISKIESGVFTLQKSKFGIESAVQECLRMVEGQCKERYITVQTKMEPDLPEIFVDARCFRQILLNVLSNAVKFTPNHGEIVISTVLSGDERVRISISDNGIGIAPENLKMILEPFGQVAHSDTRNHGGVGLGLSIVKSLVEQHEGTMTVQSELDEGTTVEITIPILSVNDG